MSGSAPLPTVTVEIVDDHFLFAQALGGVVGEQPGWTVVGLAVTAPQALAIAKERQPQVILLDYHLPGADADVLIPRLRLVAPSAKIIILTGDTSAGARRNAQAAGADGFLTKETAVDDVIEMVATVLRGTTTAEEVATAPAGWAGSAPGPVATPDGASPDGASEELMEAIDALLRGSGGTAAPDERPVSDQAAAERSDEVWSRRLEALAPSVRADALAVALPRGDALAPFAAWGLPPAHNHDWLEGPVGAAAGAAFARRTLQHQPQVAVPLAGGTIAVAGLAAPVTLGDRPAGVVVAFRTGEPFTRADATPMTAIAEAVAAALADRDALHRAEGERAEREHTLRETAEAGRRAPQVEDDERTHAVALHAVERAFADSTDTRSGMERAAIVTAGALDVDVVGIWLSEPDGRLRCAAAQGYPGVPPLLRVDTDTVLVRVALGQRTETAHYGPADGPPWAGGASDLLLAPITAAGIVRGLLIEGRRGRGFGAGDVALAPRLAATIGSLGAANPVATPSAATAAPTGVPLVAPVAAPATAPSQQPAEADATPPAASAADAATPAEPAAPDGVERARTPTGRGTYLLMVVSLVLAVAATAAGLAGLGLTAYLAAVALVFVALLSLRL